MLPAIGSTIVATVRENAPILKVSNLRELSTGKKSEDSMILPGLFDSFAKKAEHYLKYIAIATTKTAQHFIKGKSSSFPSTDLRPNSTPDQQMQMLTLSILGLTKTLHDLASGILSRDNVQKRNTPLRLIQQEPQTKQTKQLSEDQVRVKFHNEEMKEERNSQEFLRIVSVDISTMKESLVETSDGSLLGILNKIYLEQNKLTDFLLGETKRDNQEELLRKQTQGSSSSRSSMSPPKSDNSGEPSFMSKLGDVGMISGLLSVIGKVFKAIAKFGLLAGFIGILQLMKDPRMLELSKKMEEFSTRFSGFYDEFLAPILSSLWEFVKDGIFGTLNLLMDTLTPIMEGFKNGDILGGLWEGLKVLLSGLWDGLKYLGKGVWKHLEPIYNSVTDGIVEFISEIGVYVKEKMNSGIDSILKFVGDMFNIDLSKFSIDSVTKTISESFDSIKEVFSNFWDSMKNMIDSVMGFIKNPIDYIKAVYKGTTVEEVRRVETVEKEAKIKAENTQKQLDERAKQNFKIVEQKQEERGFFANIGSVYNKLSGGDRDLKSFVEESNGNMKLAERQYVSYLMNIKKLSRSDAEKQLQSESINLQKVDTKTPVSRNISQDTKSVVNKVAGLAQTTQEYNTQKEKRQAELVSSANPAGVGLNVQNTSSMVNVNNNVAFSGLSSANNPSRQSSLLSNSNKFN